ncbi:MAG: type IX secretion system membrane protein PorP/SprF, partial [Ginsengibacter sp.]
VNSMVIINPAAYYTRMANASELVAGMSAAYNLSGDGDKQIIGGLFYRYNDAVIPMVGLQINRMRFTFTYDVTSSSLKSYNNSFGADEFNLMYKGDYSTFNGDRQQTLCPVF